MESMRNTLPPNPRDRANILSVLTFWWTTSLFYKGYRKVLDIGDLYQPMKVDLSEALADRLERKWRTQVTKSKPSLIKAVLLTFWFEYAQLGFITFFNQFGISILQPILLGQLLLYFRKGSEMTHQQALYCAGGIVTLTAISILSSNKYIVDSFHLGMKVRVAVCSVIYRKSLRLSRTALGDTAPGKIVNLLSNDVNRFDVVTIFLHSMWSAPLIAIIISVLIWREIGWAGMVGICVVMLVVPVQSYTGKLSSRYRLRTALRTDERVRFMDEIISGVQVIKMYAWEKTFSKLIQIARRMELKIVKKSSYVRGLYMTFLLFTTRMAMFATMVTIVLTDQQLTASKVFVILAYFSIITQQMSQMFVRGVAEIAEVLVALGRLQKFLEYSEKNRDALPPAKEKILNELGVQSEKEKLLHDTSTYLPPDIAISIKNGTARWKIFETGTTNTEELNEENKAYPITLNNINIDFKKGTLIGIVGPVGAGKSSLLQAILKELPLESGSMAIQGKLSYACQEPWVFAGTAKQNITFGQDYHRNRYDDVVKCCALLPDFEQFPYGDKSLIGERGASLSGGQKARINLARAVYRKADVYLLDDPLSAVDAHVGRHLFDNVIGPKGRLALTRSTRILVTHQVHYLKEADWIIVFKDGKVQFQGTPTELSKSGIDIAEMVEVPEEDSDNDEDADKNSYKGKRSRLNSKSSVGSSFRSLNNTSESNDETDDMADRKKSIEAPIDQNVEQSSKGKVVGSIIGNYFKAGAHPIILVGIFLLFALTQITASLADWWISYFTAQEELREYYRKLNDTAMNIEGLESGFNDTITSNNTIVGLNPADSLLSTNTCIYIHGCLVGALFIIAISRSLGFYATCVRASQNLHDGMFKGLILTTMRFFDTNPSGRILNRFSKDMGSVDELLPKAMLDASQMLLQIGGSFIVTIAINPLFLIPMCFLGAIFLYLRKIYLKTSKNIKRVEGITRSPVYSHLAATLTGLSTIRAFEAEDILMREFDTHQDLHTGAWFMFIGTSAAFGFFLDLLCLVFIGIVTFSFLLFDTNVLGDQVGLAVTQALSITGMLQWGVRQSAEVANYMMSVERLLEYRDLPSEKQPAVPKAVNKTWPSEGKLEFRSVVYKYFEEAEPVLKGLSFVILPREKIGIVGRTGAGKSSLIGAIFRLALVEGDIFIDGIETGTMYLDQLRSKVSIIPQDPVLFSGTLRRNLDPFEEYPDADLWKALDQVELKDIAGQLGLQSAVLAGGSNYSVGQRQLICLARAILRQNKVLVLDEATANVDPQTDLLIQRTIRQRFADCTVLTVAHRLHTIMDSDRVLVMNFGKCEELATPHELLQKEAGIFKDMVVSTGPAEYERLAKIALDAYQNRKDR